jgi:hypothetical protein
MILRQLCRLMSACAAASALLILSAACGSEPASAPATPAQTPGPQASPAKAPAAAAVVTIVEPADGSSSGHVDLFRWTAVEGADGYRVRLTAVADGRTVWESPVVTTSEARLPNTIALEPEGYVWTVTAMRGAEVLVASAPSRFTVTP